MAQPNIRPPVEVLYHTTEKLEEEVSDIKDRMTRVEVKLDNQSQKVDDIHKWSGWFFKTIIGSIIAGTLTVALSLLIGG